MMNRILTKRHLPHKEISRIITEIRNVASAPILKGPS
jgi:hypothetical protein